MRALVDAFGGGIRLKNRRSISDGAGRSLGPVIVQALLVLVALAMLGLAPVAGTPTLLIPITAASTAELPALVTASGARLLSAGPVAGSLIVIGGATAAFGVTHGIIATAAADAGCGPTGEGAPNA